MHEETKGAHSVNRGGGSMSSRFSCSGHGQHVIGLFLVGVRLSLAGKGMPAWRLRSVYHYGPGSRHRMRLVESLTPIKASYMK